MLIPLVSLAVPNSAASALAPFTQPMRHGVVFWQPASPEDGLRQLEEVAAQGYRMVILSSWCWTLPTPGSDLERTVGALLDWCDEHGMVFYLLQNIQFGSAGEGGDLDQAIADPLAARRFLDDWVRLLAGHRAVAGVILGNEVGPAHGTRTANPLWWEGLLGSLRARYGDLAGLNAAWGTAYESWEALEIPEVEAPGRESVDAYAEGVFASFYGALFDSVLRPALGDLEYGIKGAGDPILHRRMGSATVIGYDDVLANYPQWRIKALCDTGRATGKPVFNSEIHLYHDTYAYNPSEAMTRYRYLTSALNGETTTASFAWGQWSENPAVAAIHARTPSVLAELERLHEPLAALAAAEPAVRVLLTRALCRGDDWGCEGERPAAERLYAEMAGLGEPWAFVLEEDLSQVTDGVLFVPEGAEASDSCLAAIGALPQSVTVVDACSRPADAMAKLREGAADPGGPYAEVQATSYLWWLPERGTFREEVLYPRLEARRVPWQGGWLFAVINHATEGLPVRAPLPWPEISAGVEARELTSPGGVVAAGSELDFAPLTVRVFAVGHATVGGADRSLVVAPEARHGGLR